MMNTPPYPPEESAICAALVKEIGSHNCWLDKVNAWQALLNVRSAAKSMRDEREHLNPTTGVQSGRI
jgi:hypothetical protein